jgi:hypothetical protein
MKTLQKAATLAAIFALLFAGPALSQVTKDGMGKVLPVELYACKYLEGKDAGDLDQVISRWSKFMDDNAIDNYAAWTLTPYHFGSEQDFDVVWMGAFSDGNAMGSGINTYFAKGGDIQKGFDAVLDCSGHSLMSSAMYRAPVAGPTPASAIITMMDCELNKGKRYSDIQAAEVKWAEYLTGKGSKAGYWHWFPVYGGGDAEYDYKVVFSYADYTELGADFELNANGGGREAGEAIFDDIDDCDDARVYLGTSRRAAQLR